MAIAKQIYVVSGKELGNYENLNLQLTELETREIDIPTGIKGKVLHKIVIENVNRLNDTADIVIIRNTPKGPTAIRRTLKMNQTETVYISQNLPPIYCGISTFDMPNVFNTPSDRQEMLIEAVRKVEKLTGQEFRFGREVKPNQTQSEPGLE